MIESDGTGLIGEHQATMPCQAGENNLGIFDYFCFGGEVLLILLMPGNFCVVL